MYHPSGYGSSVLSAFNINDLQVYAAVCYLNNVRIKNCVYSSGSSKVTIKFQFALPAGFVHVMVTLVDPRNSDSNGFLFNPSTIVAINNFRVYMLPFGGSNSYIESDSLPTFYSLPSGTTVGPFRGIKGASINYGSAVTNLLNPIHMTFNFNRTDIT